MHTLSMARSWASLWLVLLISLTLVSVLAPSAGANELPQEGATERARFSVVVTADVRSSSIGVADVEILDVQSLERQGARTLSDALLFSPDVWVLHFGSGGAIHKVGLRGGSPQALIQLNGMRLSLDEFGALSHLPLSDVEAIELIKSPAGALGATSFDAINIVTRSGASQAGTRAGSSSRFAERDLFAVESTSIGDANLLLSVGHSSLQAVDEEAGPRHHYVRLEIDQEHSPNSEGRFQLLWSARGQGGSPEATLPATGSDFETYANATYTYDFEVTGGGHVEATLYGQQGVRGESKTPVSPERLDNTFGAALRMQLTTGLGQLLLGAQARQDSVVSEALGGKRAADSGSAHITLTQDVSEFVRTEIGAQAHAHEWYQPVLSPSLAAEVDTIAGATVRASAAHQWMTPTLDELFRTDVGDNALQPAQGWKYQLGTTHELGWGELDLGLFRRDMTNLITWLPDGAGRLRPRNIPGSRTHGLDVAISAPVSDSLTTAVGLSLLDTRNTSTNEAIPLTPSQQARWGLHYDSGATRGHLEVQYLRARPTPTAGSHAQALLNGGVSHTTRSNVDLFARGVNLFDAPSNPDDGHVETPARTLWVGASLSF